jgi:hypothetical protein
MQLTVRSLEDVERQLATVRAAAAQTQAWLKAHDGDPMELLRSLKFEAIGCHPISNHALNVIEQINQTFTYAVALAAARKLLELHPEAGGFHLAPGAHASLPLDIMSEVEGLVGAETFAAVTPRNNGKLNGDLAKLATRPEAHRYVFFASPVFPGTQRLHKLERSGIQVWSLSI